MQISIIAALTPTFVIGHNNQLLWHLPADLRHFKALTLNKPIIMGKNTYRSIAKPLPNRHNIVLTRQADWSAAGVSVAHSLDEALALAGNVDEVMIIGGAEIYQLFYPLTQKLYLTWVDYTGTGDTHFPSFDLNAWEVIADEWHPADEQHAYSFRFMTYLRVMG